MVSAISQRPKDSSWLSFRRIASEKPGAKAEQNAAAKLETPRLQLTPGKRPEQWQPGILELGQLLAADAARKKLPCYCLQARFGRNLSVAVQSIQPLAPPGQPDRAEMRVGARRHDVREGEIETPKRRESGPDTTRQLLERDLSVVVELALSDR